MPFHAKVLPLDFLLDHAEEKSLWKACPNLYNQEIFDIIQEIIGENKFPYNSEILFRFKEKYKLTSECDFISSVVYCTQQFADFVKDEKNGLMLRQQYDEYELITKDFLTANVDKKILIAGQKNYCRIKYWTNVGYVYLLKGARSRGFKFKMIELVKAII